MKKENQTSQIKAPVNKKSPFKNIFVYLIMGLISVYLFSSFIMPSSVFQNEIPFSELVEDVRTKKVEQIKVSDDQLDISYKDGQQKMAIFKEEGLIESFSNLGIDISASELEIIYTNDSSMTFWINLISQLLPTILFVAFFFLIMKQAQSSGSNILSFGKSKAKLFSKDKDKVTFDDADGVEEAKKELQEVVEFLKNPGKFTALGAKIPRGVLLVGPPGTGKTLLARAVAGEADVPFFSIAGSEFMEMLVGVGASRVRDLFDQAKKSSPAILFIDELDAIGRQRGSGIGGGHDEREQTLNQILVEMDGFDQKTNIIVIAATNRPDILDPALLRPGRFDRRVVIDYPDKEGRKGIIEIHMKNKPVAADVDIEKLARRTVGFSGADIENMLNEAAILAASQGKKEIFAKDIEDSATKVKLGPEKKRLQSEEDRKIIAYHEAGHALTNYFSPQTDPVHRISIVSRGLALGFTMMPPKKDRYNENKTRLISQIVTLLGGRAAEEIVFDEFTVGAASDIEKGTNLAREMVCRFGMSSLGPILFGEKEELVFLSRDFHESKTYSEEMASKIDQEIKKIIDEGYKKSKEIIKENRVKLDMVMKILMKKETIEGEEFEKIMLEA